MAMESTPFPQQKPPPPFAFHFSLIWVHFRAFGFIRLHFGVWESLFASGLMAAVVYQGVITIGDAHLRGLRGMSPLFSPARLALGFVRAWASVCIRFAFPGGLGGCGQYYKKP